MKTTRLMALGATMLAICGQHLYAQSASNDAIAQRLTRLEHAVDDLSAQVTTLTNLLKATLPPPPVQQVTAFNVPLAGAETKGSRSARIALIEWSDFQCPFCGRYFQATYSELQSQFVEPGRVLYVFRNLPLQRLHPFAFEAAEAAACAGQQGKFWEMHDQLFAHQNALGEAQLLGYANALSLDSPAFAACLKSAATAKTVNDDLAAARTLGLTGTPSFLIGEVTPDGSVRVTQRIDGAVSVQVFESALNSALAASVTAKH